MLVVDVCGGDIAVVERWLRSLLISIGCTIALLMKILQKTLLINVVKGLQHPMIETTDMMCSVLKSVALMFVVTNWSKTVTTEFTPFEVGDSCVQYLT